MWTTLSEYIVKMHGGACLINSKVFLVIFVLWKGQKREATAAYYSC